MNEIELQKQESMIKVGTILDDNLDVTEQQGKSDSPGNDTDAEGVKISKNGSDDDITIAKSSHDIDKPKAKWSNNRLFKHDHELLYTVKDSPYSGGLDVDVDSVLIDVVFCTESTFFLFFVETYDIELGDSEELIRSTQDIKEMKDVFVSMESDLDETLKQNELLKDLLLEVTLAEDVKNLVITFCVEIRSWVETHQCDEVEVKVDFDEIETTNIELEHQVASLLKEN
uniref:Uncharacterized protein n=1 Tax=Tanacetum cinerariifolium TaxID=118510 RepID=A0A6L2NGK6_TANCI|nr:hypothetical protein [Tanacetum cinerariifolium]